MITDSLSLIDYFKTLAVGDPTASPPVAGITAPLSTGQGGFTFFREGDAFDIISAATSNLTYPLLWLETPDWRVMSDNNYVEYDLAIVALTKALKDDRRDEQVKRNDMQLLLWEVIKQVNHDAQKPKSLFRLNMNSIRSEPLDRVWNSSNWGWRLEFKILLVQEKFC